MGRGDARQKKYGDETQDKKKREMRPKTKKRRDERRAKKNGKMRCEMKKKWRDKI